MDRNFITEVDKIVDLIIDDLSEEKRESITNTSKEKLFLFHIGIGSYIRNKYIYQTDLIDLYKDYRKKQDDYNQMIFKFFEGTPDALSTLIIEKIHDKLIS